MTLQQLKYIVTVTDEGSLNKASKILYVSQPSLTSSIQELENELGIQIFLRSPKGIKLTSEGEEFLLYARMIVDQSEMMLNRYGKNAPVKKKFGVSCQHYSFAVKSFVKMVQKFGMDEYDFALRETKTMEVIEDVDTGKSEIGILYKSDFNEQVIQKILDSKSLEFIPLMECKAYVYLWKHHPLAKQKMIEFDQLQPYPNLAFEQGAQGSFYFSEEILSTYEYPKMIKVNDRATMLNLMIGLQGYTLCSGIICEELNGSEYVTIPLNDETTKMKIGYIKKKYLHASPMASLYIEELKKQAGVID